MFVVFHEHGVISKQFLENAHQHGSSGDVNTVPVTSVSAALKPDLDGVGRDRVKWYAIYVRSRFEKKVYAELVKKVECFLPLIENVRTWSDRKKKVQEPLFRGYVFVRIDIQNRLRVLETNGVVKFVGIRDRASAIPEEQINWIKIALRSPDAVKKEQYPYIGQKVEVVVGFFKGIRGVVSQWKGKTRLVISVDSISQAISFEVQPEFLSAIGG